MRVGLSLSLWLLLCACSQAPVASDKPPPAREQPPVVATCKEPRPQVCPQIYDPVCATRDTGIRCITAPCPSSELKTMGNACSACSDPKVSSYVKGECPAK